jgi:bifunctional oligoribonuclease and PAP phosphatase NrnA
MDKVSLAEAAELIRGAQRVLVTSHPGPDGDAIGSTLAAYHGMRTMGKDVIAYNPDSVPGRFSFLPGAEDVVDQWPTESVDLTVILDCSDERIFPDGRLPSELLGKILVVDHHKTLGDIGDVVYHDEKAAAVGILLYRIFTHLGVEINHATAEGIYCSIFSDTGSFRYQNTNPEAMRISAEMLEIGIDPWRVASHVYEMQPVEQLRLLSLSLDTLAISADGRAAALTVSDEMLATTGATPYMVDGFINYARGIKGVEVAILMRPKGNGPVRVSFRSRGLVDVSALAVKFGGGGHYNAAGCRIPGKVEDVRDALFKQVAALLNESGTEE